MKSLYIECNMGVAGDMLMAALYELFDDKKEIESKLNNMGLPDTTISFSDKISCGIKGTYAKVLAAGIEEDERSSRHKHIHLSDINSIIDSLNVSESVRDNVRKTYSILASAESEVHGCDIENIHFHEVGTLDAIVDITACCYMLDMLSVDEIIVSPINVGSGSVRCTHGVLPVPAPATANILRGIPFYSDSTDGELCTPTGAALIKCFASKYSDKPKMTVSKIGYGIGKKDFEKANCVRLFLSEANSNEKICELACNMDDMTAEELAYACEVLLDNGALDVYQIPISMKKSRLGTMLNVLCREADRDKMLRLIFKHTTTIGIREYNPERYTLERSVDEMDTILGPVKVKCSHGYDVCKSKIEFEDLKQLAKSNNISIMEARELAGK
ncbi:MAG: nickel pincer cofactor biosynthesis protein LarC [Clostridium sp.]|nr:nickel pincer cofactor biosynthesis protein LarC [Clostridium sp.]